MWFIIGVMVSAAGSCGTYILVLILDMLYPSGRAVSLNDT